MIEHKPSKRSKSSESEGRSCGGGLGGGEGGEAAVQMYCTKEVLKKSVKKRK